MELSRKNLLIGQKMLKNGLNMSCKWRIPGKKWPKLSPLSYYSSKSESNKPPNDDILAIPDVSAHVKTIFGQFPDPPFSSIMVHCAITSERASLWEWRGRKWRRGTTYSALALWRHHYIIPHPMIYLLLEFEANRLKMTELLNGRHFEGGGPEKAPRRHARQCSVPATLSHDVPSYDLALSQIRAKSVEKRQSYCIFSILEVPPELAPSFRF